MRQDKATATVSLNASPVYQDFFLPNTYARGTDASEVSVPPITGFSVLAQITPTREKTTCFDWRFERYHITEGWNVVRQGTYVSFPASGSKVWADVYFDPIFVDGESLEDRFRIVLIGKPGGNVIDKPVSVGATHVTVDGTRFSYTIRKDTPFLFDYLGTPSIIWYTGDKWMLANQQNVAGVWYGTGLSDISHDDAYRDGDVPVSNGAGAAPLTYRLLTASGDTGRDFLGNTYRHSLFSHKVSSVSTVDGGALDKYWFSKPNPSRFAVENLYFNVGEGGNPSVVDSLLIDPITPDVYFNVYYTSEGAAGTTAKEWDEKLWTRVNQVFQARRRETHVFPEPIRAKYIKVEFTHLQPKAYNPGSFQQPIQYQKHPKWVLDYFLLRLEAQKYSEDSFVARRVNVRFNALDIAYNYYLDDLDSNPLQPVKFNPGQFDKLSDFITNRSDRSDLVDPETLVKINLTLNGFRDGATKFMKPDSLLGNLVLQTATEPVVERGALAAPYTPVEVSTLNRDRLVTEQSFPVTFFYLTARHRYRELSASFDQNRAYFVGVREIAFLREKYSKATDTNLYVEIGGDSLNIQSSDFIHDDNELVISDG